MRLRRITIFLKKECTRVHNIANRFLYGGLNMYSYFQKYDNDIAFYEKYLAARLPSRIIDAHVHLNLPEHVSNITAETIAGDWALECGLLMSMEDAKTYFSVLLPETKMEFVGLPWPLRDADTVANNHYIQELIRKDGLRGLFTPRPEYSARYIEEALDSGSFVGFKPYPYMASATKGADVSIFEFMPKEQFEIANRRKMPVLMHLPRAGRLPDADNIKEIQAILNDYPDVKLVLAHFGRCFNQEYFEQALERLGDDVNRLWFDTAAVLNPKVYELAFQHLDHTKILFGTDAPILLWHGKREWKNGGYINLCREDFSWNQHYYPEQEKDYVFFVYEQLNNILNTIGENPKTKHAVFYENAEAIYKVK